MKTKKNLALFALTLGATAVLAACGGSKSDSSQASSQNNAGSSDNFKAVMVSDTGGIDDKSFNQGAWEGLQEWGKNNGGKTKGNGIDYILSKAESDYTTNLNTAVLNEYNIIFAIGFKLQKAVEEAAKQNPDAHFAIIDSVVEQPNVASINYKDQEAAFLAGVAAGLTTKTNKVAFIGGMHGPALDKFEAGFKAGVQAVNLKQLLKFNMLNHSQMVLKQNLAEAMYASDVDIIYAAAGGAGLGVFAAAKSIVEANPDRKIWVIGVDQDQQAEGKVNDSRNVTLTSTLKGVKQALIKFSEDASKGNYHGGEQVLYGLSDNGVGLADGQLSDSVKEKLLYSKKQLSKENKKFLRNLNFNKRT